MTEITPNMQLVTQRQLARKLAMIAVYQWQMTNNTYQDIYLAIQDDRDLSKDFRRADPVYFQGLVRHIMDNTEAVDAHFLPLLDRGLEQLGQIELAALRVGVTELQNSLDVPYKVVVNESVNLTKKFGADQAHKLINSLLDQLAKTLRATETGNA